MKMKSDKVFHHPSEQTYKAIGECRKAFATTRGVDRSAIDHLLLGDTKDSYPPFRDFFKDVCATPDADPDVYINDLLSLKQQFRPSHCRGVVEAFMSNLGKAHEFIEIGAAALADGSLTKDECRRMEKCVNSLQDELSGLRASVIDQLNILNGSVLPEEIRDKARRLKSVG